MAVCRRALQHHPDAKTNLGRLVQTRGQTMEAVELYLRALRFGKDRDLRESARQATLANADAAYEDNGSLRAFESALTESLGLRRT